MNKIQFTAIGIIHSPLKVSRGAPIQPRYARGIEGRIEIFPEYVAGLADLAGFSHITLIYYFHKAKGCSLRVVPFLDDNEHGVFATRSPHRPNPIGISVVKLLDVRDNILRICDIDALDGTPLLDIKPFVPEFFDRENIRLGWLHEKII